MICSSGVMEKLSGPVVRLCMCMACTKRWKWYMHERHGVWKADFIDLGDIKSLIVGCDGMISQRFLAKATEE